MEQLNKFLISYTDDAKDIALPKYETSASAGLDLRAKVDETTIIQPMEIKIIPTGIKIQLPVGFEAQIRPRSGLAAKKGIGLVNSPGTIDADYRGEICVIMINFSKEPFEINRGDRIAQMVINKIEMVNFELVNELDSSDRGEGGFGHTGVK